MDNESQTPSSAPKPPAEAPAQVPASPPSQPRVNPSAIYPDATRGMSAPHPNPLLSQSDVLVQEQKQTRKKRLLIGGGIVGVLIVAGVAAVFVFSFLSGMKTTTYDNGEGSSFQLKFYARHTVKAAPGSTKGLQQLVSEVSKNGLYPLALTITRYTQKPSAAALNCTTPGSAVALPITNGATGHTVNICSVNNNASDGSNKILYIGVLPAGNNYYFLLFTQDVNLQQATSSPQKAHAALQKIDITAYNNDITTIVSSIKPL